jgi:NitT/TauT family transport system substrate-binding protein
MNQSPSSSTAIHRLSRRQFIQYSCISIGSSLLAACANSNQQLSTSSGLEKVTFGTNWIAQAEHGGFYQAMSTTGCAYATGIYKNHGLDVTIKMGGLQVPSGTQLLMGDAVDFFMGYGIDAINAVA